jgi:hypothetical protein
MVVPVSMRVPVVAPRIVASIRVAAIVMVMTPAHHDRCRCDDDGRWDAETDIHLDSSRSGLRGHKQGQSHERNHTPHA